MDDVLKVFRVIAPEFAEMTDEEVTEMLELFAPMVSKHTFGTKYNLALAYFVAHIISLNNVYTTTAGASSDASDYMSLLYKTYYGRMYLQIMKLCAIGIKTRFG